MNKTEALARLDALESEAKKLREIIDAPEPDGALLKYPQKSEAFYSLERSATHELLPSRFSSYTKYITTTNVFDSYDTAFNYGKAIDTFLLLRHQPGTVSPTEECQHTIDFDGNNLCLASFASRSGKISRLSPSFATMDAAIRAVDIIGEDRIRHMFRTFHHVKD